MGAREVYIEILNAIHRLDGDRLHADETLEVTFSSHSLLSKLDPDVRKREEEFRRTVHKMLDLGIITGTTERYSTTQLYRDQYRQVVTESDRDTALIK